MNIVEMKDLLGAYKAFLTAYSDLKAMMEINFVEDPTTRDCEYLGLRLPIREVNELDRTTQMIYELVKKAKQEDNS